MAAGDIWEVTSSLNVRSGPGTSYGIVSSFQIGQSITEIEGSQNGWIRTSSGYSSVKYLKWKSSGGKVNSTTTNPGSVSDADKNKATQESGGDGTYNPEIISDFTGMSNYMQNISKPSSFFQMDKLIGVFGLPYQFLPSADCRTDIRLNAFDSYDGIGMEYADKIVSKMPILFIAPGKPSFMTKYSDSERTGVLNSLIADSANKLGDYVSGLSDLISSDGKYYTFEYDLTKYYQFVNPMCRIAANFLEIGDFVLNGQSLATINWATYTSTHTEGVLPGTHEYLSIPFYLDSDPTISENFDNSTTESSLASTVNGVSDLGRELKFLTGYTSSALDQDWFSQNADIASNIELINNEIEGILGKGNFLTNLTKHLNTVASGGRLTFPQIWSESGFSRSYQVTIKLVAPDANKLSVFLNILVPLFHLVGMVAPQSIPNNPNGYTNPFIVRAIFKSHFNVDMGIITDMSVTRGSNCQWTVEGIPTSIEVNLTIKDLYDVMSITSSGALDFKFETMSNTAQMDYIANLCGINMYKPEIARQLTMWLTNAESKITDIPTNVWTSINQSIAGGILNIFRGV